MSASLVVLLSTTRKLKVVTFMAAKKCFDSSYGKKISTPNVPDATGRV